MRTCAGRLGSDLDKAFAEFCQHDGRRSRLDDGSREPVIDMAGLKPALETLGLEVSVSFLQQVALGLDAFEMQCREDRQRRGDKAGNTGGKSKEDTKARIQFVEKFLAAKGYTRGQPPVSEEPSRAIRGRRCVADLVGGVRQEVCG